MKPRGHPLRPTQHLRISERAPLGTPSHERLMLLELSSWDPRLLKDIGLAPYDVRAAVRDQHLGVHRLRQY